MHTPDPNSHPCNSTFQMTITEFLPGAQGPTVNFKKAQVLLPWSFQSAENERHSSNRHRINIFIPLVLCVIVEINSTVKVMRRGGD